MIRRYHQGDPSLMHRGATGIKKIVNLTRMCGYFLGLNFTIRPDDFFMTVNHQYPDFYLTMHSFVCSCDDPTVQLTEHIDCKWLYITESESLDWAAADMPIVNKLFP